MAITLVSAFSARRRGVSSQSGQWEPSRSFGIATSSVPTRVSNGRCRYPLRRFVRSVVTSPYGAPQIASASALISAAMNLSSIARSTSGAWASSSLRMMSVTDMVVLTTASLPHKILRRFS
jgi:hypothetical protein